MPAVALFLVALRFLKQCWIILQDYIHMKSNMEEQPTQMRA